MRKKLLSLLLGGTLIFSLIGCKEKDENTITIGVSAVPHREIVEQIVDNLEEEGYKLEIKEFSDYVTPNTSLEEGELDANFFQHIAFLNETNESKNYNLTYTAEIHIEPMGVYSNVIKSLDDIKEGMKVAIPNDPTNEARALRLLEKAGLITLPKENELITYKDIINNNYNLEFIELEAAQLPRALEDSDLAVINGNYALQSGLDVNTSGIFIEDKDSEEVYENRNILAVKEGSEDSEKIKALTKALTSEEVRQFIKEKYKGTVIPVF